MRVVLTAAGLLATIALLPREGEAQRYGGMPAPAPRQEAQPEPQRQHYYRYRPPARMIFLNDGSILADLGWGYEQLIRSCALTGGQRQTWVQYGPASGQRQPAPTGTQQAPSGLQPAPGQQPVPGWQPAPGQQSANTGASNPPQRWAPPRYTPPQHVSPVVTSRPAPCWTRDARGNLLIVGR